MRWPFICCFGVAFGVTTVVQAEEPKRSSEKIGERVSRGAIHESLEVFDEPESRERLGRILSSPELRAAMRELTVSIVLGVFDGVHQAGMTDADVGEAIRNGIDKHIAPAAVRMTRRIVDAAITEALADEHIDQVEQLAEGTTRAVLRGVSRGLEQDLGPALAVTIERDLGPAIAVTLSRDILPAVGRGLDTPEMKSAVANLSRSIATELIGGAGDAIDVQTEQDTAEGTKGGLNLFGARVARGYAIAMLVVAALGTMLVALTIMAVRSARRQRVQTEQANRREAALLHLVDSIEGDHPELTPDIRLLRDQLRTEH